MVDKPHTRPIDLVKLAEADGVGKPDTNIEAKDPWGYIADN